MLEAPNPLPGHRPGRPKYPKTKHADMLISLVQHCRLGAEIGVLRGSTMNTLLSNLPDLKMIGVDAWAYQKLTGAECEEDYKHYDMRELERQARAVAEKYPGRCRLIKGRSVDAAEQIEDESLDFVFLDAGHTEEAVISDIVAWAPKVKPDGVVFGHDWWFPTVRRALDRALPGWERHEESVWSVRKGEDQPCLAFP